MEKDRSLTSADSFLISGRLNFAWVPSEAVNLMAFLKWYELDRGVYNIVHMIIEKSMEYNISKEYIYIKKSTKFFHLSTSPFGVWSCLANNIYKGKIVWVWILSPIASLMNTDSCTLKSTDTSVSNAVGSQKVYRNETSIWFDHKKSNYHFIFLEHLRY